MSDKSRLKTVLARHGQEHLLRFWDELDERERSQLAGDIHGIDFDVFQRALERTSIDSAETDPDAYDVPDALSERPSAQTEPTYARARELGTQVIRNGRVAALTVAGGQATRLGHEGPKGAYPIAPVSGKSLFQLFAESILATNRRYDGNVPWYVMTSPANHDQTIRFFEQKNYFGLSPDDVNFFPQGMIPVADPTGKILLETRCRVALAPNGHGGCLTALADEGMLEDLARRGVDYISYFQVDNPLAMPVDPLFVGMHALERSEMSSLTMGKAADDEKVGHFVLIDGKLHVAEYTTFPETLTRLRMPDGQRKFDLANIAMHVLNRAFVERLVGQGRQQTLPWHHARKIAPYVDLETGATVNPDAPNASKLETFIFDALPLANRPMLLRTIRHERFSPVKSLEGVDSVVSARRDMLRRAAAWLEACGVGIPKNATGDCDCMIEISPLYALDAAMLREREDGHRRVAPGASVLLE
ncbi:MAG: UTP--glucose-1-phosphate uridylyltransferase [Phycisphaerae bacterium]